jgi:muramoyltetrapeptide carboxypeptidase
MTNRLKPPRLQPGMTLGVVAPSTPVFERSDVYRSIEVVESLGFKVVLGPHALDRRGYHAGYDRDRADDLLNMFLRDDVDAVLALQGGTGATRTAHVIDHELLARVKATPPKAFIGYSNIYVLHALFAKELNWVTFAGPGLSTFRKATDYTIASFRDALMNTEPFDILPNPDDPFVETLVPGVVEAEIVGATMPTINYMIGTPWEPDLEGKIVFLETNKREPLEVDLFLSHLIAAGKLQKCAGIIIGELFESAPRRPATLSLADIFDDLIVPLGIPAIYNLPIGHGRHHGTVPLGVMARLDATNKSLRILEPGVI